MLVIHHIIENKRLIWKYLIFQSSETFCELLPKFGNRLGQAEICLIRVWVNRSIRGHGVCFAYLHLESWNC